ncbi:MAG: VOC family protein [Endomicrobium sp.]|jgi:predicted lactoylglutathione lyase|nr:VOC family protein [Endomicrobium sp.]
MNRINIIALSVKDLKKSKEFYENLLGFQTPNKEENPAVIFFDNNGTKLELCPADMLVKDINETNPPRISDFSGITLAYNAKTKEEIDEIFAKVESLGGKIVKRPRRVFWGGYSGYFQDLDGHYWEAAFFEGWKFDENNMLIIE